MKLDPESIQELFFGQGLGSGALLGLIPSSIFSLLGTFLVHMAGNLHLGSVLVDHGDGAVAVGVELGDLLGFLQLAHLVKQGRPPRGESKVDEQVAHVLACAIFDSSDHLMEGGAGLEVAQAEDDHPRGSVVARDNLLLGHSHAQLPEHKLPHILGG